MPSLLKILFLILLILSDKSTSNDILLRFEIFTKIYIGEVSNYFTYSISFYKF